MPGITTFTPPTAGDFGKHAQLYKWTWTADASTGAVSAAASTVPLHGYIVKFKVQPGVVAPTEGFTITLLDPEGCDVLGGEGANRSATLAEQGLPLLGGAYAPSRVDGVLTFNLSGNSVNSATGEFYIYIEVD